LLVYGEQGLGDEIMFASCLPDVLQQDGEVIVECDPRLAPLFQRSFPSARVHGRASNEDTDWLSAVEPIDVQIPIGSLPSLYRRSLSAFPARGGYLQAEPSRVAYWQERLSALGPGRKVGISWRGGTVSSRRDIRSIALAQWLPILQQPGVEFVSLQYTDCADELADLQVQHGVTVHHWQEAIDDYDETAALVTALDLVVSVCTSVVSLCSALGRPVWVLVPSSPGWIFMHAGDTTPWFPCASLVRQQQAGDWQVCIERMADKLGSMPDKILEDSNKPK
jgi:hypothetical protein